MKIFSIAARLTTAIITASIFFTSGLHAQQTVNVNGKVIDAVSGDPIIGVNVILREQKIFAVTDIDGNYVLQSVPAGVHKIEFQMSGYELSVAEVNIIPGKKNSVNISMSYRTAKEVVVSAKRISNTSASLMKLRQKSAAVQDAISSEQIEKSPDSDAADTAKRVTGITILGDKYIYVRGLSERYSGVLVNGSQVSSPLPNKRVIPLDIFPTGLMDNMIVSKTYTASMPADFGGGMITINTKDFPEKEELKIGLSVNYNTETTFKDFNTFDGGKLDYLGYDDGTYQMPKNVESSSVPLVPASWANPGYTQTQLQDFRNDFSKTYEIEKTKAAPGGKLSFTYGDSYMFDETAGEQVGLLLSGSQGTGFSTIHGRFQRFNPGDKVADYEYDQSKQTTNTTLLLVSAYSPSRNNDLKLTAFYTHDSEKTAREKDGQMGSSTFGSQDVLQMIYTTQVFSQLKGRHYINLIDSKLEWFGSFSWANRDQPDTRTSYRDPDGNIYKTEPLRRYYNEFNEYTYEFSPHISVPFNQWNGLQSKVELGTGYNYKTRRNDSRRFIYYPGVTGPALDAINTADFETLFEQGQYYVKESTGTSAASGFDSYEGVLTIFSGYGLVDLPIIRKLRLITGLRVEKWEQQVDSFSQFNESEKDTSKIGDIDFAPSSNLVYSVLDDFNIRLAYSRTINRPDFIEASSFRYFDDIETGAIIKGNPDLEKAIINNYDVRFEYFQNDSDIIAVSCFYKKIENPIEASISTTGGDQLFTYYNQKQADNYGAEFEINKSLGFINSFLSNLSIYGNYTYVLSKIKLDPETKTSEPEKERPLQGQSPWVVNTGLFFDHKEWGTNASILLNMFGRRITQVSTDPTNGHIYEETYPKLDISLSKTLGIFSLKLNVENILDPDIKRTQKIDGEKVNIDTYNKGITASLGLSAKF